jgi:hypothetical protein
VATYEAALALVASFVVEPARLAVTLVGNNTLKTPLNAWYAAHNAIAINGDAPWN